MFEEGLEVFAFIIIGLIVFNVLGIVYIRFKKNKKIFKYGICILSALSVLTILFGYYTCFYPEKIKQRVDIEPLSNLKINTNIMSMSNLYNIIEDKTCTSSEVKTIKEHVGGYYNGNGATYAQISLYFNIKDAKDEYFSLYERQLERNGYGIQGKGADGDNRYFITYDTRVRNGYAFELSNFYRSTVVIQKNNLIIELYCSEDKDDKIKRDIIIKKLALKLQEISKVN